MASETMQPALNAWRSVLDGTSRACKLADIARWHGVQYPALRAACRRASIPTVRPTAAMAALAEWRLIVGGGAAPSRLQWIAARHGVDSAHLSRLVSRNGLPTVLAHYSPRARRPSESMSAAL